jgi:hypothetical protein
LELCWLFHLDDEHIHTFHQIASEVSLTMQLDLVFVI